MTNEIGLAADYKQVTGLIARALPHGYQRFGEIRAAHVAFRREDVSGTVNQKHKAT